MIPDLNILYKTYRRHKSDVKNTVRRVVEDCYKVLGSSFVTINVTGSGGLFVNKYFDIPFVQEVVSLSRAINTFLNETDVAIELGGEDSKIIYFKNSVETRMNSICAGGTGAFIDQMATLLKTDAKGLNDFAENAKKIYPIASRCGVFAKTDVQALINQGATKEDISCSVLQSVVNQTISNLACGRPIEGSVAFLGGPLHFLPELKNRFVETLELKESEIISPEDGEIFVAKGAAVSSMEMEYDSFTNLMRKVSKDVVEERTNKIVEPLFKSEEELKEFKERHKNNKVKYRDLKDYSGPMYLGIDSGSTTSKLVVLSSYDEILYSFYANNGGDPLSVISNEIKKIYRLKRDDAYFKSAGSTGYGEDFIKAALSLDTGEVETIAHFEAAKFFDSDVDFVIDIGGQDMKSMKIKDGVIESILLNEACSSGCGSFLEAFSSSIGLTPHEFSEIALSAKEPVDLGSRCTVFMNSNVKQVQKEGSNPEDIAAGLAYSVIKNAIQKVIKIRDPKELGEHIVVQGGTFLSDAVLRSFEILTGRNVTRPKISGLMGAFGVALIAKRRAKEISTIISEDELLNFNYKTINTHCNRCVNNCAIKVNIFPNGQRFVTGNRCEKGAGVSISKKEKLPNLYQEKYEMLFNRKSLMESEATRGTVGIPRVLNMYENYPFWHTFFTELGYRVVLSDESTRKIYEKGIDTIPSETACYPAKLVHGHIENLIEKGVVFIFYPAVFYERRDFNKQTNHLNCRVVCGYSEVIKNNLDNLKKVKFLNPFLSLADRPKLAKRLMGVFKDIPKKEIKKACEEAFREMDLFKYRLLKRGSDALEEIREKNGRAVVLCGRPYHLDKEINHGLPEMLSDLGLGVLTEDSVLDGIDVDGRLRVLDQWTYHARLYRAAKFVGKNPDLELIQLNSFGCGIDAITTDQVQEILHSYGKIHTVLKIDEVNNLGAIKIRVRSLLETVENRKTKEIAKPKGEHPILFTKENKKTHTILMPQMSPIHFALIGSVMKKFGFNLELLDTVGKNVVDYGLKYVNNDACYPSIFVVGQFIEAVKSGKYDTNNLTLVISQTGGACRASNYVGLIRKALKDAGYSHVPVLALSFQGIENHPGIEMKKSEMLDLLRKMVISLQYGDLISRCLTATRPYEVIKGSSNILRDNWIKKLSEDDDFGVKKFRANVSSIIRDFKRLEVNLVEKPKVGIVGEILVKYLPQANNFLIEKLEEEGAEAVISDLTDFMLYSFKNPEFKRRELSKSRVPEILSKAMISYIDFYRNIVREFLKDTRFGVPVKISKIANFAERYVSLSNQYGEGWLLTGEMVDLIEHGVKNIICVQPFGCLPNHITGKGVIKAIRANYDDVNIVPIDFDASASEVNQFNRIKLMLSVAQDNLKKKKVEVFVSELKKKENIKG